MATGNLPEKPLKLTMYIRNNKKMYQKKITIKTTKRNNQDPKRLYDTLLKASQSEKEDLFLLQFVESQNVRKIVIFKFDSYFLHSLITIPRNYLQHKDSNQQSLFAELMPILKNLVPLKSLDLGYI